MHLVDHSHLAAPVTLDPQEPRRKGSERFKQCLGRRGVAGRCRSSANAALGLPSVSPRPPRDLLEQRAGRVPSPLVFLGVDLLRVSKAAGLPRHGDDPRRGYGRWLCRSLPLCNRRIGDGRCWLRLSGRDDSHRDGDRRLPLGRALSAIRGVDDGHVGMRMPICETMQNRQAKLFVRGGNALLLERLWVTWIPYKTLATISIFSKSGRTPCHGGKGQGHPRCPITKSSSAGCWAESRTAIEAAGVEFIDENGGGPGVRPAEGGGAVNGLGGRQ